MNSTSGRYSTVSFGQSISTSVSEISNKRINNFNYVYNASSPAAVPETLLAFSDGHSETVGLTIGLTNLDSTTFSITRIDVFQFNASDGSHFATSGTDNPDEPAMP